MRKLRKSKKIIKILFIIINFSFFYLCGYAFTNTYKQYLDFTYKKVVTHAYKYISDVESMFFYYT